MNDSLVNRGTINFTTIHKQQSDKNYMKTLQDDNSSILVNT